MAKGKNQPIAACDQEWEIERDLEALVRAKAVAKDPERMKKVQALAKQQLEESKRRRDQEQAKIDIGEGKNP